MAGADLDAPATAELRRAVIRGKPFLRRIYDDWYASLAACLPPFGPGAVVELGGAGGFLHDVVPEAMTSDVFWTPHLDAVLDARRLPFRRDSLRALVMTNVLHHVPCVADFLRDAARCVRVGGVVAMIEPWVTPWSRFVYGRLHHEPFLPDGDWCLAEDGPLSTANDALAWILFQRDRTRFEREFPEWRVRSIELTMPLRYLLSGGISRRALMPGWSFGFWTFIERALTPALPWCALFARITLERSQAALAEDVAP